MLKNTDPVLARMHFRLWALENKRNLTIVKPNNNRCTQNVMVNSQQLMSVMLSFKDPQNPQNKLYIFIVKYLVKIFVFSFLYALKYRETGILLCSWDVTMAKWNLFTSRKLNLFSFIESDFKDCTLGFYFWWV